MAMSKKEKRQRRASRREKELLNTPMREIDKILSKKRILHVNHLSYLEKIELVLRNERLDRESIESMED